MNIVVVEDSPVMQRVLLNTLAELPGAKVVGAARGEAEAVALILRERPHLVLLDLFLSPGHGFKVLKDVREAGLMCKVLVMTNELIHEGYRHRGAELGVLAFHDKGAGLGPLLADVERMIAGA